MAEIVRGVLWPAMFGVPYVPDQSSICLSCEIAAGKYEAVLLDTPGAAQPIRKVGTFILVGIPQPVSWLPNESRNETGTLNGSTYSANQTTQTKAVAGFLVTDGGIWSLISGTLTQADTSVSIAAGSFNFSLQTLSIYGTHLSVNDATEWTANFATGAIFDPLSNQPRGDGGGSTPGGPDCEGYRHCIGDRKQDRITARAIAEQTRNDKLADLHKNTSIISQALEGGAWGGGVGFTGGAFCAGVGAIPGSVVGASWGFIGGALYGYVEYESKRKDIEAAYQSNLAVIERAYREGVEVCKETHNVGTGDCPEVSD